jgi:hypothetical protein
VHFERDKERKSGLNKEEMEREILVLVTVAHWLVVEGIEIKKASSWCCWW